MIGIQTFFLGIVQGLTEFLPISSSAHLILVPYFFGWEHPGLAFDVALHLGTLTAVLIYFLPDWVKLIRGFFGKAPEEEKSNFNLKHIIVGTIPAAVLGLLFGDFVEGALRTPTVIAFTLIGFGLLLWLFDEKGRKEKNFEAFSYKDAIIIGFAQALALVPGVSRAGVTITAALALGFSRSASAKFSFMLSAPIIAGAGFLKLPEIIHVFGAGGDESIGMFYGFVASIISGLFAVGLVSYLAEHKTLKWFVVYRVVLGLVILAVALT